MICHRSSDRCDVWALLGIIHTYLGDAMRRSNRDHFSSLWTIVFSATIVLGGGLIGSGCEEPGTNPNEPEGVPGVGPGGGPETGPGAEPEPLIDIPDGVIDDDVDDENIDADGYCYYPEIGYVPCDDGAPPGSGPLDPPGGPGIGEPGDNEPDPNEPGANEPDTNEPGVGPGNEPEPPTECTEEAFNQGTPVPPRILLVVDKSGSMGDDAVGYNGSKWDGATTALSSVVTALDDEVEFGLMLYPDGNANNNVCREGAVEVGVSLSRAEDIVDELEGTNPGGGTPTAATLGRAIAALTQLGDEGGARAVILATDGGPNCASNLNPQTCRCVNPDGCNDSLNCLDDVASVAAASALNQQGFPTFVIGIPGSENFTDVLSALANAGGSAAAGATPYYQANDATALSGAIEEVAARVGSCRFDLANAPQDAGDVIVRVGDTLIPRDPGRSIGWDLVDDDTVELFGDACDDVIRLSSSVTVSYCSE